MKGRHFRKREKLSSKTKSIILSVIAIIELLLLSCTMTFSWFEGTTALRIFGENLNTAKGLNSSFTVGESNKEVKYENTAELNEYIDMQANAKFSPVSSYNGEDFFALMDGTAPETYAEYYEGVKNNALKFRELSEEEKNSSIIYFQFQVTAATSKTDFWFKEYPTFTVTKPDGTKVVFGGYDSESKKYTNVDNPFRIRIDDGTGKAANSEGNLCMTMRPYWSYEGTVDSIAKRGDLTAISSLDTNGFATLDTTGKLCNRMPMKIFGYVASSGATGDSNNNGSQVLFSVDKGQTKTITMAIWIEAFDKSYSFADIPSGSTVDVDIQFCSSWDVIDTITFRDYTADQWVDNSDNSKTKQLGIINEETSYRYWYGGFEYNNTTHTWTGSIPRAVQNIKFVWQDVGSTSEEQSWLPATRGTNTVFTAFGSTAGIWYDGEVTEISFTDATTNGIVSQSANKMKCKITYNNVLMEYSMAASNENTKMWTAFIPSDLDTVIFNAYDNSGNLKYVWNGIERGSHNDYYAIDGEQTEVPFNGVVVYFDLSDATDFYTSTYPVFVSLTSTNNKVNVDKIHADGYCPSGNNQYIPKDDTWPDYNEGQRGELIRVGTTDLWYFVFDEIEPGTNITFWSKGAVDYNNIDDKFNFADTTYSGANSTYKLTSSVTLYGSGFSNPGKRFFGSWTNDADDGGTTVVPDTTQKGRWGKDDLVAGTYSTHFVHTSTTTSVSATFTYNGMIYAVDLTNEGDSKYWVAEKTIPDEATNIKFTDASGNTWSTSNDRSSTKNHYYATSSTLGAWSSKITGTKQFHFMHLYSTATSMTASYTYNGVTFTYDMTKSSSNSKLWSTPASVPENFTGSVVFKDNSGREWTATGGNSSSNNYCYAIDHPANNTDTDSYRWSDSANYMRVYFTNNKSWGNLHIHYWGGTAESTWPGDTLVFVNNNSDGDAVYVKVVPVNSSVIFNNGDGNTQTVDITGVTDMKAYYISNNSNKYTVGTWAPDSTFFNIE